MRTIDKILIQTAIGDYADTIVGLDLDEWLQNVINVALTNENGDVALFERQWRLPYSVCGHYFFKARGKQAVKAAKEFLREIFTGPYGVEIITGLTPADHKAALWMTGHLGFFKYETIDTDTGPCVLSIMTKTQWLQLEGSSE